VIPKECKRLIETDFPIAEVSRHAASEKYIRETPNTALHTWWAQRPLGACRAILLGLLLPDPEDARCPSGFRSAARDALSRVLGNVGPTDMALRSALLKFLGNFASWELSAKSSYLDASRAMIKAAQGENHPLVVDPFAGGGSIPFEALRLSCDAFASDLNPVACLILRAMLEDVPRQGGALAEELRSVGAKIVRNSHEALDDLYPCDPNGAPPIAYLWCRTVCCESPSCGAEIPLVRSFWLCKKAAQRRALRYRILRKSGKTPEIQFEVFEPKADSEVPGGTVTRAKAACVACGAVLAPDRVRAQLSAARGGGDVTFAKDGQRTGGARLLAVVTLASGERVRRYRLPTEQDYGAVRAAQQNVLAIAEKWKQNRDGLCPFPDEPTPLGGGSGAGRAFSVRKYGMTQWSDLFTSRQALTIWTICEQVREYARELDAGVLDLLACSLGKYVRHCNQNARWNTVIESIEPAFGQGTLPITWAFPETLPWGKWAENFEESVDAVARCIERGFGGISKTGQVDQADARYSPLPDAAASVWFTDPPYYDAIPYADLSDLFYVWIKRTLPDSNRDGTDPDTLLTPKLQEIVQDESKQFDARPKDRLFFETSMQQVFAEGRRVLQDDGVGCVVFAHKTTEGWEALLGGMIGAGLTITGSWPVSTERAGRIRARESAALATSVHLICRPRPEKAAVGDWADVLSQLPRRVGDWMERLQSEGVRGADLVFACIGPALEIFSKHARVETADGRNVPLSEYLEKVWEVVGRGALEHVLGTAEASARNGAAGALEEDARLTALFLWTIQSTDGEAAASEPQSDGSSLEEDDDQEPSQGAPKGFTLVFDVVRRFAQPLGINLEKWQGRVIETRKGVVRLLPVNERAQQLFGVDGTEAVAARLEQERASDTNPLQGILFPDLTIAPRTSRRRSGAPTNAQFSDESFATSREATTLDRVHSAMLLQAGGRTNALRALLKSEQERNSDFFRLANALSALYPKASEEKRLLDAMLLAVPR